MGAISIWHLLVPLIIVVAAIVIVVTLVNRKK